MSELSNDLLQGAGTIAKYRFGRDTKENRRRVYHLHQQGRLPTWKDGAILTTRKSLLEQHYVLRNATEAAE